MIYQHAADGRRREMADKLGSRLIADETSASIKARIAAIDERVKELSDERVRLLTKLESLE